MDSNLAFKTKDQQLCKESQSQFETTIFFWQFHLTSSYPGVPLIKSLDVDEGHFSVGTSHHSIVLTADDQIDVVPKLPVTVSESQRRLISQTGSSN